LSIEPFVPQTSPIIFGPQTVGSGVGGGAREWRLPAVAAPDGWSSGAVHPAGAGWQPGGEWHLDAVTRLDDRIEDFWHAGTYVDRDPGGMSEISRVLRTAGR
jgi:hypothetical protein